MTELPESEVFYLYQYLVSSRVENKPLAMTNLTKEASEITEFLLSRWKSTGYSIEPANRQDRSTLPYPADALSAKE